MTQNIYDNPEFFEGYSKLLRSVYGLAGAPEWPSMQAMLPDLKGLRVVDLGCGFGWFCRWARAQGAARVLGVDVSEKMLAQARASTNDDAITYRRADLETLELPQAEFDLAYSSLALHYVENLSGLLETVHDALMPQSRLVVSLEHPTYTASPNPGWLTGVNNQKVWPVDHYFREGRRETDWLAKGVVKHHRSLSSIFAIVTGAGFAIEQLKEFSPTPDQIAEQPRLADELERPIFLMFQARAV